jgi:hypothetical protein
MNARLRTFFLAAALLAPSACGRKPGLDAPSLTKGVESYLAQRGDLCIARQSWPVDVTEAERVAGTRDAIQMPVLERLGVVEGHQLKVRTMNDADQIVVVPLTRYELTDRGRPSYIDRRTRRPVPPGPGAEAHADLCVARVSLDKVTGWEAPPGDRPLTTALVSYTYKVDVVPWMRDPEALRVFPAVARLIAGAGNAELKEGLVWNGSSWVANDLGEASAPVAARTTGEKGDPAARP